MTQNMLSLTTMDWTRAKGNENLHPQDANRLIDMANYYTNHGYEAREVVREGMAGDWSLVNRKGKLLKRIEKVWFNHYKEDLPDRYSQYIQQIVATSTLGEHFYRITKEWNWPKGEYKDGTSCWFGHNRNILANLAPSDGYAMQLRQLVDNSRMGEGIGRCVLYPFQGTVFVSNRYGPGMHTFVELVKQHLNPGVPIYETEGRLRILARTPVAKQDNFYDGGDTVVLSLTKGPVARPDIVFDGCRCTARYSHASTEGLRVCANCPFPDRMP